MLATFSDDCRKTKPKAIIIDQSQPTETTQSANQKIKSKYATGAAKRVKLKRGKKNVTQVKIGLDWFWLVNQEPLQTPVTKKLFSTVNRKRL